jgi:hypothetical protein
MIDLNLCEYDEMLFKSTICNFIELIITATKTNPAVTTKKQLSNRYQNVNDIIFANFGQIIHSLIDKLTTIIVKKQYSFEKLLINIGSITSILMTLVDKYDYITGLEKKMIVLESITTFFNNRINFIIDIDENQKQDLIKSIDTVSLTIDLFISLQKGKYNINPRAVIVSRNTKSFFCVGKKNKYDDNFID